MKRNMVRYRVKAHNRMTSFARHFIVGLIILAGTSIISNGQAENHTEIVSSERSFLEDWLIKRDLDEALKFLSENPVFPSCMVDKGLGKTKWGSTRESVVRKLRVQLRAVFKQKKFRSLSEILERPTNVLYSEENPRHPDFDRVDAGDLASILDIYPVNDEMRRKLLSYECVQDTDTRRYAEGIRKNKELYLVLTDSKRVDAGLTFLWTRENGKLRILTIDVRLP